MRVVRIYYKVVKEIVLSDNLLLEQSCQIRRMEIGEVMEVFQGPMLDASVGVYRIHGCALKDGTCGWVTVVGKQGNTFLMPGGSVFAVLNSTPLNHDLKDLDSERCIRMLTTLQPFNPAPLLTPEPLYSSSSYYPTYGQYTPPYYTS